MPNDTATAPKPRRHRKSESTILALLKDAPGLSPSEIEIALALPKRTVGACLQILQREGKIRRHARLIDTRRRAYFLATGA